MEVTLQSIQKAIKEPTSTWLSTHEPLLQAIVSDLKSLVRWGHGGRAMLALMTAVISVTHEHHKWPTYPSPEQEGVDARALQKWKVLSKEGTWPECL